MMRYLGSVTLFSSMLLAALAATAAPLMEPVAPGIWRVTLGAPEAHTPMSALKPAMKEDALGRLPKADAPPFAAEAIGFRADARASVVVLPMTPHEHIYGMGLHLTAFECTDTRKEMVVNDNQGDEDGSSHAPVPFYVSSDGYGVYVDSARYVRFYSGNLDPVQQPSAAAGREGIATSTAELYKHRELSKKAMTIEVPVAQGVTLYLFAGPDMKTAVQRYNLFSGGGCLPPLWGMGVYYRALGKFAATDVVSLARRLRDTHMPCDVFGLEPGWHTHAYSCTYAWSPERWPNPDAFIAEMRGMGYELNLWEHAFVHPTSPIHDAMLPYAGDYRVWQGLVPDFTLDGARKVFGDYHERELVKKGITGFKLDECDNQPNKKDPWSFPELSRFPSDMDGDQMHSLFGTLYQQTLGDIFARNNLRTYGKVRSSHALAAPMPFVLYSDHYDHKDYVRGIANCGFSGILWQPEVRNCGSIEELMRRTQTSIFSPQTVFDSWFLRLPPWEQIDTDKNNAGELLPNHEEVTNRVRVMVEWRMRLIPYLYAAFAEYHLNGMPPFRAVVMDYPNDAKVAKLDDAYMMGPALLVAPLFTGQTQRELYLPKGDWFDFWTGAPYAGGKTHTITADVDTIPVFVKSGSLIPLAKPVEHTTPDTVFELEVRRYGNNAQAVTLYEDDGVSLGFDKGQYNRVELTWKSGGEGKVHRKGDCPVERYKVSAWKPMGN